MDKILLMSLGSRGDMEPYLALGEELKDAGHEIAFCMPAQFQSLGPYFPALSDRGLIQLVERCLAAFCPVMIEIRVGEQTLIA